MNRILSALALSSMFVAIPAMAKSHRSHMVAANTGVQPVKASDSGASTVQPKSGSPVVSEGAVKAEGSVEPPKAEGKVRGKRHMKKQPKVDGAAAAPSQPVEQPAPAAK